MLSAGFEPAIPVIDRLQNYVLDRTASEITLNMPSKTAAKTVRHSIGGCLLKLPNLRFWLFFTDDRSCPNLKIRGQWIKINIVT
jgi:hypothetical protein